jgi:hypothetical protein
MSIYSNITIDQGSDFSIEIVVTDAAGNAADMTGYLLTGQIRKTYKSTTATDFVCSIVNATGGVVKIVLTSATTNAMKAGRYVYDVEAQNGAGGVVTRIVEGQIEITPGVTR